MIILTRKEARKYRDIIKIASATLSDKEALETPLLFERWHASGHYSIGQRVYYQETLYKCLQTHDAQPNWTPIDAPSLWAKVLIPDENVIPDWEQPDSTNPYMTGDKVKFNGKTYESLIDNNVWSPEAYPAGWKEI